MSNDELLLPWEASKSGNHNTDGVMVSRRNPAGLLVQVLAVRFQGTVPCMCAEPLAHEVIHRVQAYEPLVNAVRQLIDHLSVAADDGAYDNEIKRFEKMLADTVS